IPERPYQDLNCNYVPNPVHDWLPGTPALDPTWTGAVERALTDIPRPGFPGQTMADDPLCISAYEQWPSDVDLTGPWSTDYFYWFEAYGCLFPIDVPAMDADEPVPGGTATWDGLSWGSLD